ncbi:MAG: CgeB family protein [Thermodesulfobacteriota bacterium]
MRCVLFYHSLISDWNQGNAHFLRGIASELLSRGHEVRIFEPADGWSLHNLKKEYGEAPIRAFFRTFPELQSRFYEPNTPDLEEMLNGADLVIVHEWNEPDLVRRIGEHRRGADYRLLFHDTHHRSNTHPEDMAVYDLSAYDGVLAFGEAVRQIYLAKGWSRRVWTWHEAADVRRFYPMTPDREDGDLVWIGNWGDDERTEEYEEFLLGPVRALGLKASVYGVRYPQEGIRRLAESSIDYRGWLPNAEVPRVFSRFKITLHIPRRPYVDALPGIPTIRPFEALACGIPLVSAPWPDVEGLFRTGKDYLQAADGAEMTRRLKRLLASEHLRRSLAHSGRETILSRHTCGHRVDQLMNICAELGMEAEPEDRMLQSNFAN